MTKTLHSNSLIEKIARAIYCDSYTQYGTCDLIHWNKTSEVQRDFHRSQASVVINMLEAEGLLNQPQYYRCS